MQKITLPEKPDITKKEGNFAIFEVRSCYPGYGMTIGNSLRRVLLSSLVGCAITSVKISGANHEFSTLPGVIEDVVEIVLNLKKVRFKIFGDGPVKVTLKLDREGDVKASDIKTTSDIEVVSKDAHIATVTNKHNKIEMEMKVEKGIGYLPVEQQNEGKLEIGNIAVDAIFTPIRKINYRVENMRVGKMTNYDKLILEIETDGSITPEEAFKEASRLLVEHFNLLTEKGEEKEQKEAIVKETGESVKKSAKEKETKEETGEKKDVLKAPIESLNISARVLNILEENKIKTVGKIVKKSEDDLKGLEGMGGKGIKEIKKSLGKLGLTLKND